MHIFFSCISSSSAFFLRFALLKKKWGKKATKKRSDSYFSSSYGCFSFASPSNSPALVLACSRFRIVSLRTSIFSPFFLFVTVIVIVVPLLLVLRFALFLRQRKCILFFLLRDLLHTIGDGDRDSNRKATCPQCKMAAHFGPDCSHGRIALAPRRGAEDPTPSRQSGVCRLRALSLLLSFYRLS